MAGDLDCSAYDVFICHSHHEEERSQRIRDKLAERGLRCFHTEDFSPGSTIMGCIEKGTKDSQKMLLLVSQEWCKSKHVGSERACAQLKDKDKVNCHYVSVEDGFTFDHPAFPDDLRHEIEVCQQGDLPMYKDEPDFWDKLFEDLKTNRGIPEVAPSGDVAYGICWSYYYGYLNIVLPKLIGGLKAWREKNEIPAGVELVQQLFVVCPTSLRKENPTVVLKEFQNITNLEKPVEIKNNRAGTYRDYDLHMYEVTGRNNEKFYVPMTMNWSLVHIDKMTEDDFFQISKEQLEVQNRIFIDKLTSVLEKKGQKMLVELVEVQVGPMENTDAKLAYLLADRCAKTQKSE